MIETDRLILRTWQENDILPFSEINKDKDVMEYLPKCLSLEETEQFYNRIVSEHRTFGYGLYAVETKNDGRFIGYVGFHHFDFDADFSPGIEIGWRLAKEHWNRGYATEAAKACIDYARRNHLFNEIYSFTTVCNHRSERVMQKIGMERLGLFSHPALPKGHRLEPHVLYKLELLNHSDKKPLDAITLSELWQLFPIILTPHQPQWKAWAKDEIQELSIILSAYYPTINHIGSTAINNIQAKPIIDILVEISPEVDWLDVKTELETAGYICMSSSGNRMSFNKGYTPEGYAEKVFHVHIHIIGDNDEIIFRDYLNSHSEVAREYEALKFSLLPQFKNDRDGYTNAKTDFIKRVMYDAKNE